VKAPLIHIAETVFNSPLAIIPEKLETILRAIGPRMEVDQTALNALFESHILRARHKDGSGSDSSLSSPPPLSYATLKAYWDDDEDGGSSGSGKPYKIVGNGIAVINLSGTLMKKGGWMASLSGCSSYDGITKAVKAAMDDISVKGLLFDSNSPGGTTHGCFECADLIYGYRGVKPMFGVANDLAASAAYALLSSCDRIFVTRTGAVGSIGVFALHIDQSAYDEKIGAKYTYVFAGEKKVDGNPHSPMSRSAKSDIQAEVDREYGIFVDTVARNRSANAKKVADTEAGVCFADGAIPLLADAVGTYDDALVELEKKVASKGSSTSFRMSGSSGSSTITEDLKGAVASETNQSDNVLAEGTKPMDGLNSQVATDIASENAGENVVAAVLDPAPTPTPTPSSSAKSADDEEAKVDPDNDGDDDSDCEDDPDCEEDDETPPSTDPKNKSSLKGITDMPVPNANANASATPPSLSAEEIRDITELCVIAGDPAAAADFILANTPVVDVRKSFRDKRAANSSATDVNNHQNNVSSAGALDQLENQAVAMANASNITKAKAYQRLLATNPRLYDNYVAERDAQTQGVKSVSQIMGNAYMRSLYTRFDEQLGGLSAGVARTRMPNMKLAIPAPPITGLAV
jgi:signal peptide peptidase SppA